MDDAKNKLHIYTKAYKTTMPFMTEYEQFMKANRPEIDFRMANNKTGTVKGSEIIERQLLDYPETLHAIFEKMMTADEYTWFRTIEGSRWFAKTYPEFAAAKV